MNIYVGNFSGEVTDEDLRVAFETFGQVESATVIKDKFTGESRGFGFVEMPSRKDAEEAMNGIKELKGRMVTVNEARPRSSGPRDGKKRGAGPRGGSGQRGGYGRQRRY